MDEVARNDGGRSLLPRARDFLSRVFEEDEFGRRLSERVRSGGWSIGLFGGVLRDLIWSRSVMRPRDIDLVVRVQRGDDLAAHVEQFVVRRTRFGGIKARTPRWSYDVWPLESTWAFKILECEPEFRLLPYTTFFNVEAAVVVFDAEHDSPKLHCHPAYDRAFAERELDINFESNPFNELCVIRSLFTAAKLRFSMSQRLRRFVARHGSGMSASDIEDVVWAHYRRFACPSFLIQKWISQIADTVDDPTPMFPVRIDRAMHRAMWHQPTTSASATVDRAPWAV